MSSSIALGRDAESLIGRDAAPAPPRQRAASRRRKRFGGLLLACAAPAALMSAYLYGCAADQYVTEFRFSVRHQAPLRVDSQAPPAAAAQGGSGSPLAVIVDSQIVVQYLKSRQVIDDITAAGVDLDAVYAGSDRDFLAHLRPRAPVEERQRYWRRMVDPFFDMSTGIVSVEVRAFRPADAALVASKALALAEKLVNDIAGRAHADAVAYAEREAADSGARLKAIQGALASYRNRNAVLFPEMQATADSATEGRAGDSLIEAKTTYAALLAQGTAREATRMTLLRDRIAALEAELRGVHGRQANGGADGVSLASVMSGYSALQTDEQIAAKVYERALVSLQDARNEASQQAVYLAAFVRPGVPEDSLYPVRWRALLETVLISFAAWCLLQLIYHGVRDHLD
jgi:capsular polysaccharide transport system permease protein